MALYKFNEILNDLMDYFILADPYLLLQYKTENHLPDDLLTEFTTRETGDHAVEEGILIPLSDVHNYPYTICFNTSPDIPEFQKTGNDLQLRYDGYCLRVMNERVHLFTTPYLRKFTPETITAMEKYQRASITIPNGWYEVSVLGGQTRQQNYISDQDGNELTHEGMEPTFEFLFKQCPQKPAYAGDISSSFAIHSEEY